MRDNLGQVDRRLRFLVCHRHHRWNCSRSGFKTYSMSHPWCLSRKTRTQIPDLRFTQGVDTILWFETGIDLPNRMLRLCNAGNRTNYARFPAFVVGVSYPFAAFASAFAAALASLAAIRAARFSALTTFASAMLAVPVGKRSLSRTALPVRSRR